GMGLAVRPARRLLGRPSPLMPSSLGRLVSGPVSGVSQPQIHRWALLPPASTPLAGISRLWRPNFRRSIFNSLLSTTGILILEPQTMLPPMLVLSSTTPTSIYSPTN